MKRKNLTQQWGHAKRTFFSRFEEHQSTEAAQGQLLAVRRAIDGNKFNFDTLKNAAKAEDILTFLRTYGSNSLVNNGASYEQQYPTAGGSGQGDTVLDSPVTIDSSPTDSDRELVEGEVYEVERNPEIVSETDTEYQGQSDGEELPSKQRKMGNMEADSTDVHGGFAAF